ncbi:DUF1266 domain-containing protein [Cohnella terricola]|uniref:DUF1266 domain-containing protein n=1 Tax=Cohnella terricola TaxID=1289167 RepID=A0A559JJ28_9BACL|nr:DUF1266 domain-containing protein [Cohnella terricola]TVX99887.1 DUF1266 domain-containing protein [Cohnella terricola]
MNETGKLGRDALELYKNAILSSNIISSSNHLGDFYAQNPGSWSNGHVKQHLGAFNISDANSLRQQLEWLITHGFREQFEQLRMLLVAIPEASHATIIESETSPERRRQMSIVRDYMWRVSPAGIAAFDCSTAMFCCCGGKQVFTIEEAEHWSFIERIVQLTRELFSNWRDYLISLSIGSQFATKANVDYVGINKAVLAKLLASEHSLLRQVEL